MPKLKQWMLRSASEIDESVCKEMSELFSVESAISKLLFVRGYRTENEISAFLNKTNTLFHDPFLLKDMDKAVSRIEKAINGKEKITVYGDYDVDGVTSVSVIYLYLKNRGADVDYYIPNRASEGYGLNEGAIDRLKENGTSLIITVDTGITAVQETEYINSVGMELVVTDHHGCREILPDACAVVNPRRPDDEYPFKELAGVGVVFKLVTALEFSYCYTSIYGSSDDPVELKYDRMIEDGNTGFLETVCENYIDLVAIGTVADVMMLADENRLICALGLSMIEKAPRSGILALMESAEGLKVRKFPKKRKISASYIGFTIAPRINAAGRIADAALGVELFICDDKTKADEIARELCELNTARQAEENRIAQEAAEMAEREHDFVNDPVIVLASENWHHGVIGIVSSRLTEKYNMPSILISIEDGIGKGSGRSIKGLHISNALAQCSDLLIKYGGHELAAGLTIGVEEIDEFRKCINHYAREQLGNKPIETTLDVDVEIEQSEVTLKLCEECALIEPCGVGNPTPVFMIERTKVNDVVSIGEGKHTKLVVGDNMISALAFGVTPEEADIEKGDIISVVCKMDVNEFRNVRTGQMLVVDARIPDMAQYFEEESEYLESIENGCQYTEEDAILPDRDDFAAVFKEVRCFEEGTVSLYRLHKRITEKGSDMRPAKLKLALKILADVGLISFEMLPILSLSGSELYRIAPVRYTGKVNLFGTPRYKNIKKLMNR